MLLSMNPTTCCLFHILFPQINISQDEYTRMMSIYLDSRQQHSTDISIPKLITFYTGK
jgi:hypothetical protein